MEIEDFIRRLSGNQQSIVDLVREVPEEQARWRPRPNAWSILEVINHLFDEEKDDFRMRLDYVLNRPGEAWPAIDPPRWCLERRYNERDLLESVQRFVAERQTSLSWLKGLASIDWQRAHEHPQLGTLRAGDLMLSWVSHDYLHLRQLIGLHYLYTAEHSRPFSTDYAGGW